MQREELPDYKQTFFAEMDELRRQEELRNMESEPQSQPTEQPRPNIQNNILNTSQYSSQDWRQTLTRTTNQNEHNEQQFRLNMMLNPEVSKKANNIRSTQISEYSNARHNNTVFVNPKNTSC